MKTTVHCKKVWDDGLGGDKAYDVYQDKALIGSVWSEGTGRWRASASAFDEGGKSLHPGWRFVTTRAKAIDDLLDYRRGR